MNGRRVGQVPRVGAVAPGGPGPDGEVVEVLLKAGSRRGRVVALLVDLCGRDRFRESEDGTNLTPISPSKFYLEQSFTFELNFAILTDEAIIVLSGFKLSGSCGKDANICN